MSVFQYFSFSPLIFLPLAWLWFTLIYHLGAQWSVYEQYNYGWAVPFLCLYLIWRRVESRRGKAEKLKPETLKCLGAEAEGGKEKTESGGGKAEMLKGQNAGIAPRFSFSAFQLFSIFLLCLLYAPTRFFHEANPIWRLTSLLWTLEVIGITLLMLPFVLHAYHASRVTHYASGISALCFSDFRFPILFFLVAVPWPSGLENLLTQSLMRLNVTATVELLGVFGIPAIQHGNLIEIATGSVGIDEACSGIRSFQATLMLSLFFGEVYSLSARRRAFCVLVGFVLAFAFNVGRTLFLTQIASVKGIGAVALWHDPAGVTILVGCFLSLWLVARGLKGKAEMLKAEMLKSLGREAEGGREEAEMLKAEKLKPQPLSSVLCPPSSVLCPEAFSFSAFQYFSVFLIAWFLLVEAGTQLWYRSHEHTAAVTKEWSVNLKVAEPAVTNVEIPSSIRGQFNADRSLEGRWQDSSGNAWQLYYFRWLPAHSLKGRVAIQLAKVHGPEICLPAAGMTLKKYLGVITVLVGDTEIALQQYLFTAEGRPIHIFYGIYEDPTGSAVLANRRQNTASRIKAALAGSRNYGQRFLEVAVVGHERPDDAKAALTQQLQKLIKVEK